MRRPATRARAGRGLVRRVVGADAHRLTLVQPFEVRPSFPRASWYLRRLASKPVRGRLDNKWPRRLRTASCSSSQKMKGGGFMSGRMKALLVALGALGFAAMNGSLPWGP